MDRRQTAIIIILLLILAVFGILRAQNVSVHVNGTRPTPAPMLFEMHDYANMPNLPGVGAWMYWGWDQVADNFDVIDAYLAKATAPVAISIMLIEGIGADSTPYAKIGIPEGGWVEGAYSYPRWNDQRWNDAYRALVMHLGARYNSHPLIHSVWICTGLYGEAIFEKGDWKATGHNPGRWVCNAIDWYVAAFPTKPLFFIGSVTARSWADYAASKGIGVKINALGGDLPTHWRPRDGSGSLGIMNVYSMTVPIGFEHAFPNTPAECYWAMLTALAFGADAIDLPDAYLQTMAATQVWTGESLLAWTQRMMAAQDRTHFWIGRQTAYACPAGAYDCGWPYPLAWRASCNNCADTLRTTRDLPATIAQSVFGLLGAGKLSGAATFDVRPKTSRVRVTAIVAGNVKLSWGMVYRQSLNTGNWELLQFDAEAENWDGALLAIEGEGYVHLILVEEGTQPDSPTMTPIPTAIAATATPYSTETPEPLITPTVIKPTDTVSPTATQTPSYAELLEMIEEQQAQIEMLIDWGNAARRDLDRIMKLLDSWEGD